MESMLESALLHYGYLIVFIGTIIEGDATLLAASFLVHRGYFSIPLLILTATVATSSANQLFYFLARRHGAAFLERRSATDKRFAKVAGWVQHRGALLLLASRFMWGLRAAIPAACGATGMPPLRFFIINVVGAAIWCIPFTALGYAGGHAVATFFRDLRRYEGHIAAVILVGTILLVLWRTHGEELKESWKAVHDPGEFGVMSVETLAQPRPETRVFCPPGEDDWP